MQNDESRPGRLSRREALGLLGLGARFGLLTALPDPSLFGGGLQRAAGRAQVPAYPKGAIVRTILKDVTPDQLGEGATLIHEHLSLGKTAWGPPRPNWQFTDDVQLMTDEVNAMLDGRVSCIVDAGNMGLGRNIERLRQLAMHTRVHIVACGGLRLKADHPPDIAQKSEDQIADEFVRDAKAERWGALGEIGTGPAVPMDPDERKILRAVAKVHVRTGLPIITHTSGGVGQAALDQVEVFEAAGVDLRHLVIGHLNDIKDETAATPIAIAKRGAYVSFDHSGKPDDARAAEHVRTIMAVLSAGHEDKVLLSGDLAAEKYLRKNGGPGIDMIFSTTVPQLRQAGVGEAAMRKILVENPRRALAFVPKQA